ncbi:MAG: putative lipid II flippase FtsW [Bdellovibrionota bacterium]
MRFWPKDVAFFWMTFALSLLGLITLYSVSSVQGIDLYGDSLFFLRKQIVFATIGFVLMLFISHVAPKTILKLSPYMVAGTFVLLAAILVPGLGFATKGGARWLNIGELRFQPSEFAKITLIIFFAARLSRTRNIFNKWKEELVVPFAVLGIFLVLFLQQPDFGNSVILAGVILALAFLAGAPWKNLFILGGGGIVAFAFLLVTQSYRMKRLLSFMDPWKDPQNANYQIVQSFIAFYRGGWLGVGLGNSQSKLYFLPEVKTDFIASILAEEVGVLGFTFILILYGLMVMRGLKIAEKASEPSHYLLAAGATLLLGFQALLNLAVVLSLLPTKGLPLPFVSMGGSSLISSLILCGLVQSVAGASEKN